MKNIPFCFLLVSLLFSNCSLLIRNAVNKKYPPVNVIDKKIQSVTISDANLDTSTIYSLEADISKEMIDTVSNLALQQSNAAFPISSQVVDSIKIDHFSCSPRDQEVTLKSSQLIYLSTASNKWISGVDFYVSASLSPYYSNDSIYLNPYFNRIHIRKVYFKKCAFLTKLKPLVTLLNELFDTYLANINGQIKNYYVKNSPIKEGGISLASILDKQPDLKVVKDDTIRWKSHLLVPSFLINKKEITLLLRDNTHAMGNKEVDSMEEGISQREKIKAFKKMYLLFKSRFEKTRYNSFDSTNTDSAYLAKFNISESFLQTLLNETLDNLNFQFTYPIGYNLSNVYQDITLGKPNVDCGCDGIVDNIFHCSGGIGGIPCRIAKGAALASCYVGSFGIPGISTYMTFCLAMKALPGDFQWTIGSIAGNAQAACNVNGTLNQISFSNNLSQVTISKQLQVNGNINYDFNFSPFNKFSIGGTIFAILTQCANLQLRGNPAVDGSIPNNFVVDIAKEQAANSSDLKITIEPFLATVNLSQSPGLAIISNFKNYFTCNIGYNVIGIAFVMAHIIPDQVIPDKFRDYYDVATKGKLDHTFEIHSFKIPLSFSTKSLLGESRTEMQWGVKSINSVAYFPPHP